MGGQPANAVDPSVPPVLASHPSDREPSTAVVGVAADGCVQTWGADAERLLGHAAAQAIGQPFALLIGAELRPGPASTCLARRSDGSLLHLEIEEAKRAEPTSAAEGRWVRLRDATELKLSRTARLVANVHGALLDCLPDAIVVVDVTGGIVFANAEAERLFDHPRASLLGHPVETLLPQRHRVAHVDSRAGFFAHPRTRAMGARRELHGLRRNGDEFPAEVQLSTLETAEGILGMSAVRDISQRMDDRRSADRKFRDLLESAPDAMVIVDPAGRIVLVNSQAVQLFGWTREELLGQPVELLVPKRYGAAHVGHRAEFHGAPKARSMGLGLDLYGVRKDGSEFPVEISLSPIETEDGLFVSSAIRDASERRRIEQALQQANRMKSEFLANMSHELRTPLNGIIGFSELLVDGRVGPLNPTQKGFVSDVLSSGRHLLQVINDVLDLSKVEAGKMQLFPEAFEVPKAVDEVCAVIEQMAQPKRISVHRRLTEEVPQVTLDRQRFKQVLFNLMSNAVKFTEEGGEVSIDVEPHDVEHLRLRVSDTGIGMRAEDVKLLFVEFQQLDSGAARRFQGTGLGLALTRRLVECQEGSIGVSSELGKGSVFTVVLPRHHRAPVAAGG
jgi:protein-histidine pros-kinase